MLPICVVASLIFHGCLADYIGAVVEYNPSTSFLPNLTIEENLDNYVYQIEQAKTFGAQIIVFPEYGLSGLVDNPDGFAIPIPNVGTSDFTSESYYLRKLSNAALQNEIVIVVNLLERAVDSENNTIYYNTNVAFASNGTLIARYRKINLFTEPALTAGTETAIFTTDFGTFALITCMDILYYHPSVTVLENTGVTDVIWPAAWISYIPLYMSLQVQLGYATANRVNLLSANYNRPSNGRGGSSIIRSDGVVIRRILSDNPAIQIAYGNVESSPGAIVPTPFESPLTLDSEGLEVFQNGAPSINVPNYIAPTAFEFEQHVYQSLDLSSENVTQEICHEDFCCNFNIVAFQNETNPNEIYKLVAFNGRTLYDTNEVGVKFCALIGCLIDDVTSCGTRPPSSYNTTFRQITVWGVWETFREEFYRPISLRASLEPAYNSTYLENRTNETIGVSFNLTLPVDNVIIFGLFGRSGVESLSFSLTLIALPVMIRKLF